MTEQHNLSRRQIRWLDEFQEHDLRLEWISGTSNRLADLLSRRPHDSEIGIQVNALLDGNNNDFFDQVRLMTSLDQELKPIIEALDNQPLMHRLTNTILNRYIHQDGLLWYQKNCLVIPYPLHLTILHEHHDAPSAGHPSWTITYELLARHYYWPKCL